MTLCCVDDCTNVAQRAGYCWGHYKRKLLQRPLSSPPLARRAQPQLERALAAATQWADAETDAQHDKALQALRDALRDPWRPRYAAPAWHRRRSR